ncbi:GTPase HflX [Geitlerinema sp. PCC 9228]|uniref:GTPase HflX n=1 Tax=Geitlerinema sp. PCC 9228 TaxID=111611 RepID=UPI0009FC6AA6
METIHGNLKGLKSSELKQLQKLYRQKIPVDAIATPEFAQRLAAISTDIGKPISTYINRRGQVIRVGVGTPRQTQIPPLELPRYGASRLCGIRCITTQAKAHPPNVDTLTTMAIQRWDALATLILSGSGFERRGGGPTGYIQSTYLAHLASQSSQEATESPESPAHWHVSSPLSLDILTKQDFLDLVEGLEEEFEREHVALEVEEGKERVLVVGIETQEMTREQFQHQLTELQRLVESAGGTVLDTLQQKRSHPHQQTVVGSGKVDEIALSAQTLGASLVVFDRDLSPAQVRNVETRVGVRVCDRTELILDIFAQRARTRAGKLQVELAQLEYLLPRLTGRGEAMSRLGGGIGTRGPGETKLETERRAIQKRISRLQKEVNHLQEHRERLRHRRQSQDVPSIAIVGYTNAGKSTLLNALTSAHIYTANQLFATLDPTTRRLVVPHATTHEPQTIVLTDTVGFIHELPPSLIDAFRATLEEVTEADALLQVVDLSHPAWRSQVESVSTILGEMPLAPGPMLMAFNKIDCVDSETLEAAKADFPQAAFVSAQDNIGLEPLRQKLGQLVHYTTCV